MKDLNLVEDYTLINQVLLMKGNGLKIEKLDSESTHTQTVKNIKEIGWMDKNMEKGHIIIKMVIFI